MGTILYKLHKVNCKKWFVIVSCIVALAFSAQTTFFLRKELSSIENQNRFQTTKAVCQYIEKNPNAVLITENSLLYLMYSDKDFMVCDVITMEMVDHIFPSKSQFILITDNSINYLQERYAIQLDFAYLKPVLSLENATLYKKSP